MWWNVCRSPRALNEVAAQPEAGGPADEAASAVSDSDADEARDVPQAEAGNANAQHRPEQANPPQIVVQ